MRGWFGVGALALTMIGMGCSAGGSGKNAFGTTGSGGSTGNGSSSGSGGSSGSGNSNGSGGLTIIGQGGSNGGDVGDASCPRTVSVPEEITVYQDASYTDTITTYSPIAIYIMQDRSSSMVGYLGTGDANSWPNSQAAVSAFIDDPLSTGLHVGLGSFPPYPSNDASNCSANCDTPIVPIAQLSPAQNTLIKNAYSTTSPGNTIFPLFTPTECGLNGMVHTCAAYKSQTGMSCVGLLITDGAPSECNTDPTYLAGLLSTAYAAGMKTFVLGLPGGNISILNQLAQAGGSGAAIDLTGGTSQTAILAALNTVRDQVSTQVTTPITTPVTISTKLPCDWGVPSTIDKTKTNLEFTPSDGAPVEQFGHVPTLADCSQTTQDAWYYDDNTTPTKVTVCPATCDKIKAAPKPTVSLIFGCSTVEIFQ